MAWRLAVETRLQEQTDDLLVMFHAPRNIPVILRQILQDPSVPSFKLGWIHCIVVIVEQGSSDIAVCSNSSDRLPIVAEFVTLDQTNVKEDESTRPPGPRSVTQRISDLALDDRFLNLNRNTREQIP